MAQNDIEVEIKIPTDKQTFEKVRRYLQKHAQVVSKSQEIDKYYNSPHRDFLSPERPVEYLRIRITNHGSAITYKKIHLNEKGRRTHSDEYESRVEDTGQLEKILSVLDFVNFLTVNKQRESFQFEDKFEIDLDFVKGLGHFVEIEALKKFKDKSTAYDTVANFAITLGLDPEKVDLNGYVLGLMKKKRVNRE